MVNPGYLERARVELEADPEALRQSLILAAGALAGDHYTAGAAAVLIMLDRNFPDHQLVLEGWRAPAKASVTVTAS